MPFETILHEVDQLHSVSTRLEKLADQHTSVSKPLRTIARTVRNTATCWQYLWRPETPSRSEYGQTIRKITHHGRCLVARVRQSQKTYPNKRARWPILPKMMYVTFHPARCELTRRGGNRC